MGLFADSEFPVACRYSMNTRPSQKRASAIIPQIWMDWTDREQHQPPSPAYVVSFRADTSINSC